MDMQNLLPNRLVRLVAGSALAGAALLTGCQNMVTTAPTGLTGDSASITGVVHGGQNPVSGATVRLYVSGTGGYGKGSVLKATSANTDAYGGFAFTKNSSNGGNEPNTGSSWSCPATGDPIVYITAVGGISQGSLANPSNALMAVLGNCSTVSSSTTLTLNEITTVGSVFAMAQYINPGTTPGTLTMGTSSSAQGTVGINNAAANVTNLVSTSAGLAVGYNKYNGTGTAAGAYVTATPESAKIITIADVLAACINSPNTSATAPTSTGCADLFANALPPLPAVTSQPTATFTTAQDTIQAAYYMATNPDEINTSTGALATPPSCASNPTAPTALNCLFGLTTASPPFQTGLGSAPSDWTIGVTFTSSLGNNTCGGGTGTNYFLMAAPYHGAADANGNFWFINGGSTVSNLVELSPTGVPLACLGQLSTGRGITIDTAGNVWASFNGVVGSSTASGIQEVTAASIASGTPTLTSWPVITGQQTYTMTSDGSGNVFYNVNAAGGTLWEFPGAASASSPVTPVQIAGPFNGTTATTLGYIQADPTGRIWDATSSLSALFDAYPSVTAPITAYAVASSKVTFTGANSFSVGNVVNVTGLSTTEGTTLNGTYTLTAVTASSFTAASSATAITTTTDSGTATPAGGSYSFASYATPNTAYGIAIDSNNYIYQGTTCCAGTGDREIVKWTPSAVNAATNSASSQDFGGVNGVRSIAVDGAANVWLGNEYPNSSGATTTAGNYSISEVTTTGSGTSATFTSIAPPGSVPGTCSTTAGCPTTGGYIKTNSFEPLDLEVDPSGDLWVLNTYQYAVTTANGISVTEVVGAAVPVVTPLSVAAKNGALNTKP